MRKSSFLLCAALGLSSCVIAPDTRPVLEGGVFLASQYNRRGMPQNDNGVAQVEYEVDLATKGDGTLRMLSWGNVDLQNDVGDAWFGDGNGGQFTEVDLSLGYLRSFGAWDTVLAANAIVLPEGSAFPNGARGTTSEVLASVGRELLGLYLQLAGYFDFDEVDGYYLNFRLDRSFSIAERFGADASLALGYSEENHSAWAYGLKESALADLRGTASLFYAVDAHTTIRLLLAVSTMLDSDIEDRFEAFGIESDNFWASLGISWSY